jgi:hypothetical protein
LPGPGFGALLLREQRRWAGPTEARGGGRGCTESGGERGGESQLAPVSALGRPKEEVHDFG